MEIAFLISPNSWLLNFFKKSNFSNFDLYVNHNSINKNYDILFILSYFNIIPKNKLTFSKYNLVVHESNLPKGKGWAPYFWQVIEGKNKIPICLIEASEKVDSGKVYLKSFIELNGLELNEELRIKQAMKTFEMCEQFIERVNNIVPENQKGEESFYPKRTASSSELDINKTIKEQFNLLRTVHNEDYPAFFTIHGEKYKLKIEKYDSNK